MSKKKQRNKTKPDVNRGGTDKPIIRVSVDDVLRATPLYASTKKMMLFSLAGCLAVINFAIVVRLNLVDYEPLAMFCNIIGYALIGVTLFLYFSRMRPIKKMAKEKVRENDQKIDEFLKNSEVEKENMQEDAEMGMRAISATDAQPMISEPIVEQPTQDREKKMSDSVKKIDSPEYHRYRRYWRIALGATGFMIVLAVYVNYLMTEISFVPMILLIAAYIPMAAAIRIYKKHLKPLKDAWEKSQIDEPKKKKTAFSWLGEDLTEPYDGLEKK